jgi:hypothetical protein
MIMVVAARRLVLVAHVGCSVGWLGAVVTSLVLAVAGLVSSDAGIVRAVYVALDLIGWYALVPLSVGSLLTGLVQSLGGSWGLLRHYWVVAKLLMNLLATAVLLMYMQTLGYLAAAARSASTLEEVRHLRDPSPVVHAVAAVGLLLGALVLSIYKPRGQTAYGRRKQRQHLARPVRRPDGIAASP